ncbi:MAG: hypothetical protein LBT76_07715, partial [Tannerella sp.]|nr:hypothetical protein [Tannerella sp.]
MKKIPYSPTVSSFLLLKMRRTEKMEKLCPSTIFIFSSDPISFNLSVAEITRFGLVRTILKKKSYALLSTILYNAVSDGIGFLILSLKRETATAINTKTPKITLHPNNSCKVDSRDVACNV